VINSKGWFAVALALLLGFASGACADSWQPFGLTANTEVVIGWTGGSSYVQAQGFNFSGNPRYITGVQVYIKGVHNIQHVNQLQATLTDGSSAPSAIEIAHTSNSSGLVNGAWTNMTFTTLPILTSNKQYWFTFGDGATKTGDFMTKLYAESGLGSTGRLFASTNNGSTWTGYSTADNITMGYTYIDYTGAILNINVFNEQTGAALNAMMSANNVTTSKSYSDNVSAHYLIMNDSATLTGDVSFTVYSGGYQNRTFTRFLTTETNETLNVSLLPTADSTQYTVYVRNIAGNSLPNTAYNVTRTVGANNLLVATGTTDANGLFTINLLYGSTYSFELSAAGYLPATTSITAGTLNPITIILSSTEGIMTWNTTLTSIIPYYSGQPLVQGQTSQRYANATYWTYDYVNFTGACAEYVWNATVLLNYTCGLTNNASTAVPLTTAQTGLVLQKFTVTANGSNVTFLAWLPILPSGSAGTVAYHKGLITLIAERLVAGDPTGLGKGTMGFLVIVACIIAATFIGGATVMSTFIFLILTAFFTFVLPIMPWQYFTIIGVTAFAWIYLRGGGS
jgi:hypothetical protein